MSFSRGPVCSMQLEYVRLRLPCSDHIREEGSSSDEALFDCLQPGMGIGTTRIVSHTPSPVVHTIVIAALSTDVTRLIFRPPHPPAGPNTKSYWSSDSVAGK